MKERYETPEIETISDKDIGIGLIGCWQCDTKGSMSEGASGGGGGDGDGGD